MSLEGFSILTMLSLISSVIELLSYVHDGNNNLTKMPWGNRTTKIRSRLDAILNILRPKQVTKFDTSRSIRHESPRIIINKGIVLVSQVWSHLLERKLRSRGYCGGHETPSAFIIPFQLIKQATTTMTASWSALLIFTSGFGLLCTTLLQALAIEGYPLEQLGTYVCFAVVLWCWLVKGKQRTISTNTSFSIDLLLVHHTQANDPRAEASGRFYSIISSKARVYVATIPFRGHWRRRCGSFATFRAGSSCPLFSSASCSATSIWA